MDLLKRFGLLVALLLMLNACGGAESAPSSATSPTAPATAILSEPTAAPTLVAATSAPTYTALPPTLAPAAPAPTVAPTVFLPTVLVPATPLPPAATSAPSSPMPTATLVPPAPISTIVPANGSCLPANIALPPAPDATSEPAPAPPSALPAAPPVYGYQVLQTYPHDRGAFTEGLVYDSGVLYEGTGLNGQSALRRVNLADGTITQGCVLPNTFFGEGVTTFGDKVYQLTWQSHVGFVYDKASLGFIGSWSYPSEGWGLTHDGTRLIMSDGTATIHFLDPTSLQETSRISVYDNNGPVLQLNELEYIGGEIYANVWMTDRIARIAPDTGQVLGWIDLSGLLSAEDRTQPVDVLNGIAYDAAGDRLFVTGKYWPKLFEIRLVPR